MTSAPHRGASGCSVLTYIITKVPAVSQRCDTRTGGRPSQEMKRRRTCVRPRFPRRGLFLGYVEILPNGTTWIHFRAGSKTVALIQSSSTLGIFWGGRFDVTFDLFDKFKTRTESSSTVPDPLVFFFGRF